MRTSIAPRSAGVPAGGRARLAVALLALVAATVIVAGCSTGASPSPSTPGRSPGPSASSAPSAGASPPASSAPSPGSGASSSPAGSVGGPVTTAEQAVALVLASDPRFAKVGPKDPNLIGQSAWYTVDPGPGDAWTVQVRIGWGDCPSGCIDEHVWTYEVARDGRLTLLNETGPAVPSDVGRQP